MRIAGFLFLVAALALLAYAFFFFDVSVGGYDGGRTINIGLLDLRGLLAHLGMTLLLSAFLFIAADEIRDALLQPRPRPFEEWTGPDEPVVLVNRGLRRPPDTTTDVGDQN